jgi:NADH:ubiquinone oxidoreductase subunit H
MTFWDTILSTTNFLYSMFNVNTDYATYLLSDSSFILLATFYYKIQQLVSFLQVLIASIYTPIFSSVSTSTFNAICVAFKFLVLIALLIFIRGGIPRYRFDHLTKVGWIKYLSLVLASMLIQFLLMWMC